MNATLPDTIIPWLLGGLLIFTLLTIGITIKSWREVKRSPYFFLRIQAGKRMQRYLLVSTCLVLAMVITTAYAWRDPVDNTQRLARITHAKPVAASTPVSEDQDSSSTDAVPTIVNINTAVRSSDEALVESDLVPPVLQQLADLPDEYNRYEATVELSDSTSIGSISFSTDISDEYEPLDPGRRFVKGYFTLYATFSYGEMEDGMTWSWVWRRNGEVIDGGNQVWTYGEDGPGYVYLRPEEGFQEGEYSLDVWVNEQLMAQSNLTITGGVSANN